MTQQLFEQWFRIADADRDGAVGGAEAVSFFIRSGLPQAVLGQIWELSSGGGPKLNQIQFSSAMRLVALAQARGGQLPLDQARAIIAGVGPSLPPPTLQGLEPAGAAAPGAAPPAAAAAAPGARPAGAAGVPGAPPHGAPVAVPPYGAQLTGGAPAPGGVAATYGAAVARPAAGAPGVAPPAAAPAPAPAAGGYPALPASELQRFQAAFLQLDTDRDGFVTGAECFGFFTQSGLDKSVLRDIWSLVAGNDSRLSGPQFVAYLHVMDNARRGVPLPKYLPPGLAGFPAVATAAAPAAPPPAAAAAAAPAPAPTAPASTWSLQSQFGTSSNITAVLAAPSVTSLPAPPPPPAMPAKLEMSTGERLAPPVHHVSHVPAVPAALLASVSAMDRTKLQEEQQVCEAQEKAVQTAEERAAEARARQAQLTGALQELVVFRKRTEVALLTSQDEARRLEEELEATRKRYDAGYVAAQAASEKSAAVHAHIMELMTQKADLEEKMRRLEGEVAAAERMGPADVARLESELSELHSKCAALEAARNAKMAQVDGLRRQQDAARAQLADLQDADRDAAAEVEACQVSLDSMEAELKEARSSGVASALPSLLSRAATVYRGLYGLAHRMGTAVPFEALPATLEGLHVWADEVAAGVVDWADDDVDARGYVVVNALPGADAPRPVLKAVAAAAAKPAPAPAAGAAPIPKMLPDDFAAPAAAGISGGGGFDDPPAFGDEPAFGGASATVSGSAAPPPAATAAAPPPPPPSVPVDFGFDDAPAFGAPPPAGLAGSTSFALDPQASNAFDGAGASTQFSFGKEAESSVDTPSVMSVPSAAVAHAATAAAPVAATATFDDNAFGTPAPPPPPTAAPPPPAYAVAAAASAAAAHDSLTEQPSLFGDDAFAAHSAFGGSSSVAPVPSLPPTVPSIAPADSPSSSMGGSPSSALPTADSGPLESNPFASVTPPPVLAAFTGAAAAGASTQTKEAPAPAPGVGAAAATSAELFGDSAFGAESSFTGAPPTAESSSLSLPPPPQPQQAGPAAAPGAPQMGFGDDNPFGDDDNPFSTPAFR
ncbi:hypothetical protein PLESTF_001275100 [Pleodorina starrii]|nr:hypothetical protein PLESTM_000462000 [Pleodorina starrii]GLC72655.1 hypothetical protein PLESTF_001275100 [Pleodorina starrii]